MFRYFVFIVLCSVSVFTTAADKSIMVIGDSLSAGYGINIERGWVFLLNARLAAQGYRYKVINSSISGDTTRGAKARLDGELKKFSPAIAIIELGGNDGLRGLSLDEMYRNLADIIEQLSSRGSKILLVPMQLPPNYGPVYNEKFTQVYRDLAGNNKITLAPFILDGIADKPQLMQSDGIHPVAAAQGMMLDNIWPQLQALLAEIVANQL